VRGPGSYEVIDLARTNETLHSLVSTVESALQLEPDILVLFVGNNWTLLETPKVSPYVPSVEARQHYAQALRESGVLGPIELAARELLHKVGRSLTQIDHIARSASIPVILVIPEVNLADWETRQPVLWRPGGDTARWYRTYTEAKRLLSASKWEAALAAGKEMLKLDEGTCPTTYRILAKARMGLGQAREARQACEAEVNSSHYATLCFLSAPQATSMAKEVQRRGARHHGFSCVDLPEVFVEYTGSLLPGRQMFLDYCHLTTKGIQVAMAAVATKILQLSNTTGNVPGWQTLVRDLPEPQIAPQVDATVKFGAAIHSAHRLLSVGPKPAFLEYWCEAALEASPGVELAMMDFVAARSAPCPAVLTKAQQANYASPYRLLMQHGWQYDYLDADVIEAICVALERRGKAVRETVNQMLLEHHQPGTKGVDLIYPPLYHREPLERFYPEVMHFDNLTQRAAYRSPWPASTFCLISDARQDSVLDLTARLPTVPGLNGARSGQVSISVNGQPAGTLTVKGRWTRGAVLARRAHLQAGINRVTLHWPAIPPIGDRALNAAIARLEQGIEADLHPVFGEVFSLLARPG
jgi:hypothetical protein